MSSIPVGSGPPVEALQSLIGTLRVLAVLWFAVIVWNGVAVFSNLAAWWREQATGVFEGHTRWLRGAPCLVGLSLLLALPVTPSLTEAVGRPFFPEIRKRTSHWGGRVRTPVVYYDDECMVGEEPDYYRMPNTSLRRYPAALTRTWQSERMVWPWLLGGMLAAVGLGLATQRTPRACPRCGYRDHLWLPRWRTWLARCARCRWQHGVRDLAPMDAATLIWSRLAILLVFFSVVWWTVTIALRRGWLG